jgi:Ser/Thr protein kinase RdoA (MazF antagonist)
VSDARATTFFGLTPDHILTAVEAAGLEPSGHVNALHCFENRVHDVRLDDGRHVITKFYRPGRWSREAIQDEHDFLRELAEAEIPACAPLAFEDGQTIHEVEGIWCAIWPRVGGRSPDELPGDQVEQLGRLLARIHMVGAARPARHRPRLDAASYGLENLAWLEDHHFLPDRWARRYREAVEAIAARYTELARGVPLQRIHADCHNGNLLHGRDGWFFVDFDDFLEGPVVQDVWLLLPGRDPETAALRRRFLAAYRSFAPFQDRWLRLIEPLRALRFVRYAAWIARRWDDPAFPAAFPQFGTETYWQREVLDLEEQLRQSEG